MLNLPKPKLGDVTAITMSSPDLEKSMKYYQRLGFSLSWQIDMPFPLMQLTDGALLLLLRLEKNPYFALTYFAKEQDKAVAEVEASGIVFSQKPKKDDMVKRYVMQSPDGLNISVVKFGDGFVQPPGLTMLTMPQEDYSKPEKYANKVCGMFGELAHPVQDVDTSIAFWKQLGFAVLSKFTSPYPWAILSDGLAVVGLHQTNNFSYPAITFFASDMKEKISKLKSNGLKDYSESGAQGNIVLTTPEKQHINLFTLGM